MVRRPMAEWHCIIHDASPAYISWTQYLANQARLQENAQRTPSTGVWGQGHPGKARRSSKDLRRAASVAIACV